MMLNFTVVDVQNGMQVEELLVVPKKRSSRLGLWSVFAVAVGGFTIVLGVHYMRRR